MIITLHPLGDKMRRMVQRGASLWVLALPRARDPPGDKNFTGIFKKNFGLVVESGEGWGPTFANRGARSRRYPGRGRALGWVLAHTTRLAPAEGFTLHGGLGTRDMPATWPQNPRLSATYSLTRGLVIRWSYSSSGS